MSSNLIKKNPSDLDSN